MDKLDQQGLLDPLAQQVLEEKLGPQDPQDKRVKRVHWEKQDLQAPLGAEVKLDPQDQQVHLDPLALLAHEEKLDLRDLQGLPDHLVQLVLPVSVVRQD